MSDNDIVDAMELFGGSFVAALAILWRRGDVINQAKLKAAFPDYWAHYADLARRKQQAESRTL